MGNPFAPGSVHGGWTVKALQQDGNAPRYAVEGKGLQGTLIYFPFHGPTGVAHRQLAERLKAWEGISQEALWSADVGKLPHGVWVVQPTFDRPGEEVLSPTEACAALTRAATALTAFHQRGQAHGEVDAWSLVKRNDGAVALLPPGLRLPPPGVDRLGLTADPLYAAPEVLDGQPATPASDMFSLGLVLYRLLTKKPPATARDPLGAFMARGSTVAPDLSRTNLPEPIRALYAKLVTADPVARPRDATELLRDLEAVNKGQRPAANALPAVTLRREQVGGLVGLLAVLLTALGCAYLYAVNVLDIPSPLEGWEFVLPQQEDGAGSGAGSGSDAGDGS